MFFCCFLHKCIAPFCLISLIAAAMTGQPVAAAPHPPVTALRATDFLNSLGANSAIDARGETLTNTRACVTYVGLRWIRSGNEGGVPISELIALHKETGVRYSWGLDSGGSDIPKLIQTARPLAAAGALLSFEGPNEPNNWGITYQGVKGGGGANTWVPIAKLQRDLYSAVKSDPVLTKYPVWGISEDGAETDNVGLQFLTIPAGADTVMPPGTQYSDAANVHNYIYHPNSPGLEDNKTWNAADPTSACRVDGLYGEYGTTWAGHFPGYSAQALLTLPRVTTETGTTIGGPVTEKIHGLNLLSMYLDQFKRGWSYTAVYLLRDRVDEAGNQQFGFYRPDYTPRLAAVYLHNLTTTLADRSTLPKPGRLAYTVAGETPTVHDMLLQKSDGTFDLIIWNEQLQGTTPVTVLLGKQQARVLVYDPTIGTMPVHSLTNAASIPLTLSDHPLVIAIPRSKRPV
jgi:hypothetical protein